MTRSALITYNSAVVSGLASTLRPWQNRRSTSLRPGVTSRRSKDARSPSVWVRSARGSSTPPPPLAVGQRSTLRITPGPKQHWSADRGPRPKARRSSALGPAPPAPPFPAGLALQEVRWGGPQAESPERAFRRSGWWQSTSSAATTSQGCVICGAWICSRSMPCEDGQRAGCTRPGLHCPAQERDS